MSRRDRSVEMYASARKGNVHSDDIDALEVWRGRGSRSLSGFCDGGMGTKRVFELPERL